MKSLDEEISELERMCRERNERLNWIWNNEYKGTKQYDLDVVGIGIIMVVVALMWLGIGLMIGSQWL